MSRAWRWSERAAAKIRAFEDAAEELHRSRRTAVERADERLGIVFKRQGSAHYFQRVNSAHLRFARARNAVCDRAKHLRHVFYVNFFSLCARCASERSRTQFLRERGGSRARVPPSEWGETNKKECHWRAPVPKARRVPFCSVLEKERTPKYLQLTN